MTVMTEFYKLCSDHRAVDQLDLVINTYTSVFCSVLSPCKIVLQQYFLIHNLGGRIKLNLSHMVVSCSMHGWSGRAGPNALKTRKVTRS